MKKTITCLLAAVMLIIMLAGCGTGGDSTPSEDPGDGRKKIVTTIFPQYDWVRQILGDNTANAELIFLLDSGVDLHSFQPTADDIINISTCDMLIYVGGESDDWVVEAMDTAGNPDAVAINLIEALGEAAKTEEYVEGMEHDHDEEDDRDEIDEHVWLSLKNAQVLCTYISQKLGELDPDNADEYSANAALYNEALSELDAQYKSAVDAGVFNTLLFADRFPFRYLADDYGLDYFAAFAGCSAETEASFDTVIFLAGKLEELALENVLVIETSDQSLARIVIQSSGDTNRGILVLDSLQSVTASGVEAGTTYLSVMESNLEVLKQALR